MTTNLIGRTGIFTAMVVGLLLNSAQAATLKVGDPAPKLQVGKWVQGDPVSSFESDKVYVVEFWATWCGPCKTSIPHLNDLHLKNKDKGLIVIGQDCWEQDESLVPSFLKTMGDKMTYRVALDDKTDSKKGKMAETWMEAAGQNGIPCSFLVDKKGKIAWIGHPMELQQKIIDELLSGSFDVKKAAVEFEERQKAQEQRMALSRDLSTALRAKEWDKAESAVREFEKIIPEAQRGGLDAARLQIQLGKGDMPAAAKVALGMSERFPTNAVALNQIAWNMAITEGLKAEALDAAASIAQKAYEISQQKDPNIIDTLARLTFLQGKKDQAVELQQKAVELADEKSKDAIRKTLESYKTGTLPKAE
jgi:thiol-disulfide isomerase/thioredoxin